MEHDFSLPQNEHIFIRYSLTVLIYYKVNREPTFTIHCHTEPKYLYKEEAIYLREESVIIASLFHDRISYYDYSIL